MWRGNQSREPNPGPTTWPFKATAGHFVPNVPNISRGVGESFTPRTSSLTTEAFLGAAIPKSESPKRVAEEDELDGLPVFGADEDDGDLESRAAQKEKPTEDRDESETKKSVSLGGKEAGK